jgi:hypothetical protein
MGGLILFLYFCGMGTCAALCGKSGLFEDRYKKSPDMFTILMASVIWPVTIPALWGFAKKGK